MSPLPPYTLRRSARSRGLRVTIDPRRGILVSVPPASRRGWAHPEARIEQFLREREAWLRRHLERHARERAEIEARGGLRHGAVLRYRGDLHRLIVLPAAASAGRSVVAPSMPVAPAVDRPELVVRLATADRRPLRSVLEAWLRDRARSDIEAAVIRHAEPLGVAPAAVTIRDQHSRWGSASRQRRLSFSWRLVLAPPEALETVVIHELAHLRVFGHGPAFWGVVASRRPDHVAWRRWLRHHSHELHAALDDPEQSVVPAETVVERASA
ncbi:MAG TPA: SprT family zinc-dependent metalloprotease [Candidatus Limnocylindrales bacterium]|nr:SprT family zinc-dependent metalloprotease [Candidatus Limnocylindrales bacterium]